jgi:hypothetical protein
MATLNVEKNEQMNDENQGGTPYHKLLVLVLLAWPAFQPCCCLHPNPRSAILIIVYPSLALPSPSCSYNEGKQQLGLRLQAVEVESDTCRHGMT